MWKKVRRPRRELEPFVESLWYFTSDLPHARERILADAEMAILVNLDRDELRSYHGENLERVERIRGAALCGAQSRSFGIDTAEQRRIVGVTFQIGGAAPFFAAPASAVANSHVELGELWGASARSLRERLLEAATPDGVLETLEAELLARVTRPLERDRAVGFAVAELERGAPVSRVAERVSLSPRGFIQKFREAVGVTPKRFARLRRFQRAVDSLASGAAAGGAELAASFGYFDQPHWNREFREFAGMTPSEYRPRAPDNPGHAVTA
jgi:AraC-like DNA-binding protein